VTLPSDASDNLVINGWTIFAHPFFLDQLSRLMSAVEIEARKNPATYRQTANAKTLAAIRTVAFERIPQDPTNSRYRQGDTLGDEYKHWFRDKFGNGRFRIFFRYDSSAKIIVFAWVNDEQTLRTYGAKNDAYAVFAKMLKSGNPPDDWNSLVAACTKPTVLQSLKALVKGR